MKSAATAAWSATGLAAASVIAVTVGMGLQGGAAAAPMASSAPLVAAGTARHDGAQRSSVSLASPGAALSREPGEGVPGPCDEAEHVGDTRCTGAALSRAGEVGEGVSGPCDEVEHAADPRCQGAASDTGRGGRNDGVEDRRANDDGREAGEDRRDDDRGREDSSGRRDGGSSTDDSGGHDGTGHGGSGR